MTSQLVTECVQQAAAFVAARSRGDLDAAESVLASFESDAQRLMAFVGLSELLMRMLADYDDGGADTVASTLALAIAQARDT